MIVSCVDVDCLPHRLVVDSPMMSEAAWLLQPCTSCFQGYVPLIFMATSGSTVLGSYDNLNDVADVCAKHGVWMHVDVS